MLGDDTRAALNGAPAPSPIAPLGYTEHHAEIANVGVATTAHRRARLRSRRAREHRRSYRTQLVHALEVVSMPSVAYTGLIAPAIGETAWT